MTGINADRRRGEVVWRLAPETARALADLIESATPPRDLAAIDVADLRAAADRLDPPREEAP